LGGKPWHRIELRFAGEAIAVCLDGKQLASVQDASHAHGMIALGTEWNHTQFDNLQVNPIHRSPH